MARGKFSLSLIQVQLVAAVSVPFQARIQRSGRSLIGPQPFAEIWFWKTSLSVGHRTKQQYEDEYTYRRSRPSLKKLSSSDDDREYSKDGLNRAENEFGTHGCPIR